MVKKKRESLRCSMIFGAPKGRPETRANPQKAASGALQSYGFPLNLEILASPGTNAAKSSGEETSVNDTRSDPQQRFVKVIGVNPRGFVEFEFSIGSPDLCVELMLPKQAFAEFCDAQRVQRLDDLAA